MTLARLRNNISWLVNLRRCQCEFYVGRNRLHKCHNCGGRT